MTCEELTYLISKVNSQGIKVLSDEDNKWTNGIEPKSNATRNY